MPRTSTSAIASKAVGESLRQARQALGISQVELAGRLAVSPPYIANVEAGRVNPTVGKLMAIAEALRVELHVDFRVPPARPKVAIPTPPLDDYVTR